MKFDPSVFKNIDTSKIKHITNHVIIFIRQNLILSSIAIIIVLTLIISRALDNAFATRNGRNKVRSLMSAFIMTIIVIAVIAVLVYVVYHTLGF